MSAPKKLKRTVANGTSGNTIKQGLALTIVLDQAGEGDDTFELVGGSEPIVLGAKDAKELVEGAKVLRFQGINANKQYKLIHHRSKGATRVVFLDTRPQDMTNAGKNAIGSKNTFAALPSRVPAKLPDKYYSEQAVDADLVAKSPVLLDLAVEDPLL